MPTFVKIVAILIFVVVASYITINVTKVIFNKVAGGITESGSQRIDKKPCSLPKHEREFKSELYYSGPLIDSHVHFPTSSKIVSSIAHQNGLELPVLEGDLSADKLICLFESEGITKTFGFHITSKFAEGSAVSTAKELEENYPGKIVHFLMPPPVKSLNVDPGGVKGILDKNKGLFKGFGEVGFYMDSYEGAKPDDPNFLEIYKLAEEHNLIVMIHPAESQQQATEKALNEFPKVTFLIHGGDNEGWIMSLMKKYPNFYYSLDANITSLYGYKKEHQFQKPTKEEYLTYIRANFDPVLNKALSKWKGKIETNPDRFTWGTDRWFAWHFNPEVGGILEEFGRSFIGRLDPKVQENFAYKNAEKMLQDR